MYQAVALQCRKGEKRLGTYRTGFLLVLLLVASCEEERRLSTESPEALDCYTRGVTLLDQFYYAEARVSLDSATVYDSTFAMAWARLAALSLDTRDEAGARSYIARALRFLPGTTDWEQRFIRLWDHMIRFSDEEATAIAESLIADYPEEREAYVLRGRLYERSSKLDSAILSYRKAVEIDTSYGKAVMLLGYAYSSGGDQGKAIEYMQRYIRIAPDLADPRASYADLLVRVGRYEEALEQYNSSLKLKPDYWYSINQIGYIYSILGRLRDAEAQYMQGLGYLSGLQVEVARLAMLAQLDLARGRFSEAATTYAAVLGRDSSSFDASYGLAYALGKLGKFGEAHAVIDSLRADLVRKGLTDSQWMPGFHLMRSRVLLEEKRPEEARMACEEALVNATPIARASIFRQLAEISLKTGDYERGFLECEESLSVNPNSPSTLLTLTRLYHAKGDSTMTREIGGRLLTMWKNADPDFLLLAELREILNGGPRAA
jgi:tetratricopeptide (TPR) repeat protein